MSEMEDHGEVMHKMFTAEDAVLSMIEKELKKIPKAHNKLYVLCLIRQGIDKMIMKN